MGSADRLFSVADARRMARRTLPRVVYDYVDGGAEDEVTMAENEQAFRDVAFRPRMATRAAPPSLATAVLGTELALPVLLAPCGLTRIMHPDGVAGAARAAGRAGTVFVLSTVAGTPPEDLAAEGTHRWFQLYASDRDVARNLVERAAAAGFEALVVTVDTPALGKRERDIRNGVPTPLRLDARSAIRLGPQVLARPGWTVRMIRSGVKMRRPARAVTPSTSAGTVAMNASPFSWEDVAWIRSLWSRPLVVKGILSADDALHCVDAGADAVIVSNHGGRQLEGAPATLRVLPEVVDAVGNRIEVLVDGGVRRGGDIAKALALGARAVLVGRPYLYGLAAAGEEGVTAVIEVLRSELVRTLTLLGCSDVTALDRSWIQGA